MAVEVQEDGDGVRIVKTVEIRGTVKSDSIKLDGSESLDLLSGLQKIRAKLRGRRALGNSMGVSPIYVVAVALVLTGVAMNVIGHEFPSFNYLEIFGPVVFAAGIAVGMFGGGVMSPLAYVIVIPALIGILIAVNYFNIFNLGHYGL